MKRLSPAQLRLLKEFRKGRVLRENHFGIDYWYSWLTGEHWVRGISYRTVYKLADLGMIRNRAGAWPKDPEYVITDAGKKYLEEEAR
jgi:hypothetical protein